VQGHSVGWRGVEHEAPVVAATPSAPAEPAASTARPTLFHE